MWWHILKFFTSVKEKFQVDMKKKKFLPQQRVLQFRSKIHIYWKFKQEALAFLITSFLITLFPY